MAATPDTCDPTTGAGAPDVAVLALRATPRRRRRVAAALSALSALAASGALALAACSTTPAGSAAATDTAATKPGPVAEVLPLAFLARHAEKASAAADAAPLDDPALTAAGSRRAAELAELLANQGIVRILATDTRRARDTAAPLAARLGLPIEIYDARQLPALATELRQRAERVLVVGHSNTTDVLARALGGDGGAPIADDEHDRLYVVDLRDGATEIRRYGEPSRPGDGTSSMH